MKIRIPQGWQEVYADSDCSRFTNKNHPGYILVWEYDQEGYNWHIEKLSSSGRLQSGIYNFYKNFSGALKEIK